MKDLMMAHEDVDRQPRPVGLTRRRMLAMVGGLFVATTAGCAPRNAFDIDGIRPPDTLPDPVAAAAHVVMKMSVQGNRVSDQNAVFVPMGVPGREALVGVTSVNETVLAAWSSARRPANAALPRGRMIFYGNPADQGVVSGEGSNVYSNPHSSAQDLAGVSTVDSRLIRAVADAHLLPLDNEDRVIGTSVFGVAWQDTRQGYARSPRADVGNNTPAIIGGISLGSVPAPDGIDRMAVVFGVRGYNDADPAETSLASRRADGISSGSDGAVCLNEFGQVMGVVGSFSTLTDVQVGSRYDVAVDFHGVAYQVALVDRTAQTAMDSLSGVVPVAG